MSFRRIFTMGLLALLLVGNSFAFAEVVDGPIARKHLASLASDMLYQEKFDQLERMASELRSRKERFPDGAWKLMFFYDGLCTPKTSSDEGWKRLFGKISKWRAQFPNSITARVTEGGAWIGYAEMARGSGYANTVSEEGWRLLYERLKKAYSVLEKKPKRPSDDCPERYVLLLVIANSQQGWSEPQYEALFHEAVTFEPSYQSYYVNKAGHLEPKWGGEEGGWQGFAKDAVKLTPPREGNIIYMRIMMSFKDEIGSTPLAEAGVSWDMLKQGFLDNERLYPNSPWILNHFCLFACLAGDRETARALFKRIGDRPYIEAWSPYSRVSEFTKWRDWALGSKDQKVSFPDGTEDVHEVLMLAKGGDREAQYRAGWFYSQGELIERNLAEAERWYRKAAVRGHMHAQSSLASIYFNGNPPIQRDFKEASKWYYLAAIQGDSNGSSALGRMFRTGFGLKKDLFQAYLWYSLITQWKDPTAQQIAPLLTKEQLEKADLELKKLRDQISKNKEAAETGTLDITKVQIPAMLLQ